MHCPACGTSNEAGAKFCRSCGAPMPAAAAAPMQAAPVYAAPPQYAAPAAAPASKMGLYLGGGALALVLAFGGYFMMSQKNDQLKAEQAKVEALAAANMAAESRKKEEDEKRKEAAAKAATVAAAVAAARAVTPAAPAPAYPTGPASAPVVQPAPAPAPAPAPIAGVPNPTSAGATGLDWYTALKTELIRCESKSALYGRPLCERRAREKYCTGNYGKVSECR